MGERFWFASIIKAMTPVTAGVAYEVPLPLPVYVFWDASPPRKLLHPPSVTHPSAWIILLPGALTSGISSSKGLEFPLSLLGPLDEYEAITSSSLSTVFWSSVAATVIEREEALIPERPSLSGPSFPAALETVTPASMASSRILLCISDPSEPPFS